MATASARINCFLVLVPRDMEPETLSEATISLALLAVVRHAVSTCSSSVLKALASDVLDFFRLSIRRCQ